MAKERGYAEELRVQVGGADRHRGQVWDGETWGETGGKT